MNSEGNNTNCPLADGIVSYMYDEIHGAERLQFETHLAGCTECTDDFATVSNARFSMFEWRKEEFAHLPTPEIVIPYLIKPAVTEEVGQVSALTGLRAWLSLVNFPVAIAAALVVTVGLGFAAMRYLGSGEAQLVANISVPAVKEADNIPATATVINSKTVLDKRNAVGAVKTAENSPADRVIRPVRAVATRRNKLERQVTADNAAPVEDPASKLRRTPGLSKFDEDDDKSLRLADLFDEDGG
ncbi:MAG: zf-HC2 domain-containing protein [Acidobacteriota bacterium]